MRIDPQRKQGRQGQGPNARPGVNPAKQHQFDRQSERRKNLGPRGEAVGDFHHGQRPKSPRDKPRRPEDIGAPHPQAKRKGQQAHRHFQEQHAAAAGCFMGATQGQFGHPFVVYPGSSLPGPGKYFPLRDGSSLQYLPPKDDVPP